MNKNRYFFIIILGLVGFYFGSAIWWYFNRIARSDMVVPTDDLIECQKEFCARLNGVFDGGACKIPMDIAEPKVSSDPQLACKESGGTWYPDLRSQTVIQQALACDESGQIRSLVNECLFPEGCPEDAARVPGCFCPTELKCLKGFACVPLPENFRQSFCSERLVSAQRDKFWRWSQLFSPLSFLEPLMRKFLL